MTIAPLPENEQERLKAVYEYHILDTLPETDFDDITRIASDLCHTPISLVGIMDAGRQWFKSRFGLLKPEIARDFAFCSHVIHNPRDILIVPDLREDKRFHDNPFVNGEPYVVFYAGIPLVNPEGFVLGTLCVWDHVPRELDKKQTDTLKSLSRQIVSQLELRKKITQLKKQQVILKNAYTDLEKFSYIASHDLKGPLNNIISITQMLKDEYKLILDENGNKYVNYLNDTACQLSDLVIGILNYSKSSQILVDEKEDITVGSLLEEISGLLKIPANTTISYSYQKGNERAYTSRIGLKQILMNLLHNAIKYNDKDQINIDVIFFGDNDVYSFEIKDNGPGIAGEDREKIFELFQRLNTNSREEGGMGIGLAIVKRLAEKLGGKVAVQSEPGDGTSFTLTIPKEE